MVDRAEWVWNSRQPSEKTARMSGHGKLVYFMVRFPRKVLAVWENL